MVLYACLSWEQGRKAALGFPPEHLMDSVVLQMPGSQMLEGWSFGGSDGLGLVPHTPQQIMHQRNSSAAGSEQ